MPCTQCMAPYTARRKEHGCSSCGFGFCANCLNHKAVVSTLSDKPVSVCINCYRKLTQPNPTEVKYPTLVDHNIRLNPDGTWWAPDELPPPSMRQDYASASTSHILPSLYPSLILKGPGAGAGGPIGRGYHQHPERSVPIRPPPPYSAVSSHDRRGVDAVRQPLTPRDNPADLQKRLDKLKEERAFLEQAVSSHDPRGVDAVRQPLAPRDDPVAMQKRLDKLKEERALLEQGSVKPAASVTEIEERLAALRGVSVEEIRHPSLMFTRRKDEQVKQETVSDLIEKARDEVRIEKKWDPVRQLEERYNQYHNIQVNNDDENNAEKDLEEIAQLAKRDKFCDASPSNSGMSDDVIMSHDTLQSMKDLQKTLKLAEQESIDAATWTAQSDRSMQDEMNKIATLTRQNSAKTEKITNELSKFWERNLDRCGAERDQKDQTDDTTSGIAEEEIQKIIKEAEQAENEVNETVKEVKKTVKESKNVRNKGTGFFSKLFQSFFNG